MSTWTDPLGAVICTRCGHYAETPPARTALAEQHPTICQCQEDQ